MKHKQTDKRWWWWAGDAETVDSEGLYEYGECDTRDLVIAQILPEIDEGTVFIVVEAQFGNARPSGSDEFIPFAATRNQEFLIKRNGAAEPAPSAEELGIERAAIEPAQ